MTRTYKAINQNELMTAATANDNLRPGHVPRLCLGKLLGRKSERNLLVFVRRNVVDRRLGDNFLVTSKNEADPALLPPPSLVLPCSLLRAHESGEGERVSEGDHTPRRAR